MVKIMRQESRKKYWHRNHQLLLHRLYQKTGDSYPSPVAWSQYKKSKYSYYCTDGPADGAYLKRLYRGGRSAYLKKYSAKKLRRVIDIPSGKSGYKKNFDFWWELY